MTKELIEQYLTEIERDNDVRILFAAETGSRAWGFNSQDSDWDARFIYVHKPEWYLTVRPGRDVIEVKTEDGLDAAGWDIRKALFLFSKINLTMIEWFNSPIIYRDNDFFHGAIDSLLPYFFNKFLGLYHYYHVAINHDKRYLEKRGVELKRYLYFLRSMLACKWITEKGTPPPVPFDRLVEAEVPEPEIRWEIDHILVLKRSGKSHNKEIVSDALTNYGYNLMAEVENIMAGDLPKPIHHPEKEKELDKLLYDIVMRKF